MTGWWWLVAVLAVLGVTLLAVGFARMREARPTPGIRGGFGGPAGSSDVGHHPGFEAPDPHEHWKVGSQLRIAGFAALVTAAVLGLALTLAQVL